MIVVRVDKWMNIVNHEYLWLFFFTLSGFENEWLLRRKNENNAIYFSSFILLSKTISVVPVCVQSEHFLWWQESWVKLNIHYKK